MKRDKSINWLLNFVYGYTPSKWEHFMLFFLYLFVLPLRIVHSVIVWLVEGYSSLLCFYCKIRGKKKENVE